MYAARLTNILSEEWGKIENTKKVLSISNLINKYKRDEEFFTSRHNINISKEIINTYFKCTKDSVFVNENQIIDIKTLYNRNINSLDELKTVLSEEYFINKFDDSLLFPLFVDINSKSLGVNNFTELNNCIDKIDRDLDKLKYELKGLKKMDDKSIVFSRSDVDGLVSDIEDHISDLKSKKHSLEKELNNFKNINKTKSIER